MFVWYVKAGQPLPLQQQAGFEIRCRAKFITALLFFVPDFAPTAMRQGGLRNGKKPMIAKRSKVIATLYHEVRVTALSFSIPCLLLFILDVSSFTCNCLFLFHIKNVLCPSSPPVVQQQDRCVAASSSSAHHAWHASRSILLPEHVVAEHVVPEHGACTRLWSAYGGDQLPETKIRVQIATHFIIITGGVNDGEEYMGRSILSRSGHSKHLRQWTKCIDGVRHVDPRLPGRRMRSHDQPGLQIRSRSSTSRIIQPRHIKTP